MLAKKNTGTNATIAKNSTMFSTVNGAVCGRSATRISGCSVRRSTSDEHDEECQAADDARPRGGLSQPHSLACWKPSTLEPMPTHDEHEPR